MHTALSGLRAAPVCGLVLVCISAVASSATAQANAGSPPPTASATQSARPMPGGLTVGPPIRQITSASAVSTDRLGIVTGVHELPDGRILANDVTRRRLFLMDTSLKIVATVLDSATGVANTYGMQQGNLIPWRGDSALLIDRASYAMLVIDPQGRLAGVRSVWRVQDVFALGGFAGIPGIDGRGRVVYRVDALPARPTVAPPPGVPWFPQQPDSAFIVAADVDTRRIDTLGSVRTFAMRTTVRQNATGGYEFNPVLNPLPLTDEWAVLSDGRVAFLRGRDYRIDYLHPDGRWTSSDKVPFDWQRLDDVEKQRLVDSVRQANGRNAMMNYVSSMVRWANTWNRGKYPPNFKVPENQPVPFGLQRDWILPPGLTVPDRYVYACAPGEEAKMIPPPAPATGAAPGGPPAASPAGPPAGSPGTPPGMTGTPSCIPGPTYMSSGAAPPAPTLRVPEVVSNDELPDYRPAFRPAAIRADCDGNLWVRIVPPKPIPGGPVYDIIDSTGRLSDRIQLPIGYTLVGFGAGRVVFVTMQDASGLKLARVRLR